MTAPDVQAQVHEYARKARQAAISLGTLSAKRKNEVLMHLALSLEQATSAIIRANERDLDSAAKAGLSEGRIDRLRLDDARIFAMAQGLRAVAALEDPVGVVEERIERPNGLVIDKTRTPFGVVAMIYESRPNVTVDAAGLCFKTGNAVLLRGGKEAIHSNAMIVEVLRNALSDVGIAVDAIQLVALLQREAIDHLIRARGYVDLVIPRGGANLIRRVVEGASVPVIETGVGNCHIYIDESADYQMAQDIVINAKTQRPSVCNAVETVLLHERLDEDFLRSFLDHLKRQGVVVRACELTLARLWPTGGAPISLADDEDFATEYLDLILAVKTVSGLDAAMQHIARFGTRHSEAIITSDPLAAQTFLAQIDAAVVYHNASTRFTDGYEFGFGAEIGISTQKLHARGPMGLRELTTYKYTVKGSGQVRE